MRISPEQVELKLMELADDYEKLRAILDEQEPLFDATKDDLLARILANDTAEMSHLVQDVLSSAVVSKLTIEEKAALFRAEYPKLADTVIRAQKAMKRIEKAFEFYKAMSISNQSSRKHEAVTNGLRP